MHQWISFLCLILVVQAWELAADPRISIGKKMSAQKIKRSTQIRM